MGLLASPRDSLGTVNFLDAICPSGINVPIILEYQGCCPLTRFSRFSSSLIFMDNTCSLIWKRPGWEPHIFVSSFLQMTRFCSNLFYSVNRVTFRVHCGGFASPLWRSAPPRVREALVHWLKMKTAYSGLGWGGCLSISGSCTVLTGKWRVKMDRRWAASAVMCAM